MANHLHKAAGVFCDLPSRENRLDRVIYRFYITHMLICTTLFVEKADNICRVDMGYEWNIVEIKVVPVLNHHNVTMYGGWTYNFHTLLTVMLGKGFGRSSLEQRSLRWSLSEGLKELQGRPGHGGEE